MSNTLPTVPQIVSMSTVAFMLDPDETSNRLNCALTMMLACIGFQYVLVRIQIIPPHTPISSFLNCLNLLLDLLKEYQF